MVLAPKPKLVDYDSVFERMTGIRFFKGFWNVPAMSVLVSSKFK
ncbi:MAG: hypothetical protein ACI87E_001982 [Mariniblastus sp.]|jgi:hypothetical protein